MNVEAFHPVTSRESSCPTPKAVPIKPASVWDFHSPDAASRRVMGLSRHAISQGPVAFLRLTCLVSRLPKLHLTKPGNYRPPVSDLGTVS